MKIPFLRTTLDEEEKQAIGEVIDSGWVVMGKKTEEFEQKFAEYVGAKYAVFVDSGTAALDLAVKFWKNEFPLVKKVSVPSLTFTSTAEVVVNNGLYPVFEDVNKDDFCIKEISKDSDFGIPVHLTGNRSSVGSLIYDSAHRIEKDDVKDSTALWCYSLYATKNITTIQGGMIATNRQDAYMYLKKARDHGLNLGTKERYQGRYKQYDVEFVGWRAKADDVKAAIGIEQLKKLPEITEKRNEIVRKYNKLFGLNRKGNHLYPILVNERQRFMDYMFDNEIQCTIHFRPLHTMTGYKDYTYEIFLPNTEYIGERIVSIPLFPQMTNEEIEYVADKVIKSGLLINE